MPTPVPATDLELLHLCQQGRKIEAISRRKAATNCSLLEAKQYVDALEQGSAARRSGPPGNQAAVEQQVADYCRRGAKLQAIKYYRDQTGVGLREAKEYVDALEAGLTRPLGARQSTPLPLPEVAAPRRHSLRVLLGTTGLFAALTLATSSLEQATDGVDAYGFPETFYRTGAGYSSVEHRQEGFRSFDQSALLLDVGVAFGATLALYLVGRWLLRKLRPGADGA